MLFTMRFIAIFLIYAFLSFGSPSSPRAEDAQDEIARYREMMSDPMANPAYLNVDRGEVLWSTARGAKNISLETCDLGKGPGVLDGAYAELPRFFSDAKKVMDLEQRLLWCMKTIQELDTADIIKRKFSSPGTTSDMEDLVAFIANKSSDYKFALSLVHPAEKKAYELGERLFYRRSSVLDFSCATCHGADNQRIRLQELPNLTKPGPDAQASLGSWPTYRVSQSQMRTMQHRLWDCYRQMRMPPPEYGSDGLTALMVYLTKQAEGGTLNVPSIKR